MDFGQIKINEYGSFLRQIDDEEIPAYSTVYDLLSHYSRPYLIDYSQKQQSTNPISSPIDNSNK